MPCYLSVLLGGLLIAAPSLVPNLPANIATPITIVLGVATNLYHLYAERPLAGASSRH